MKTVIMFSGQGAQYSGMGKDFYEQYPESKRIFDIAGDDITRLCFEGSEEELADTVNTQVCMYTVTMAKFYALKEKLGEPYAYAGFSLGEYAALVSSGMVSAEDGFRLIKARAEAMEMATAEQKGAMAAVMKLAPEKIEEICSKAVNYVTAVNYNSPQQTVIAGTPEGIAEVSEVFAELKARVVPLNVAGAFHSKLMQSAADKFYETAKTITFNAPQVKYYSNVTGGELTDFSDMPSLLAKHIVSPVRFTAELSAMEAAGADTFVEFGPGKTLTGLVKKTLKGVTALNIENLAGIEGAEIYG